MRVLMLEAPEALLEERRRLGLDKRDEMWDGVLHVVPPPGGRHQHVGSLLVALLLPIAQERGFVLTHETGLFRPGRRDSDYRVPDLVLVRTEDFLSHGVEGPCEMVMEIRSPRDESYEKIPFYLEFGVRDVVLVDRDTLTVEVYRELDPSGTPVLADDATIRALDVTLAREDDDHLAVTLPDATVTRIRPLP